MPIYEYRCEKCGEKFDRLVASFRSVTEVDCPKCESPEVKKTLSNFSARIAATSKSCPTPCAQSGSG